MRRIGLIPWLLVWLVLCVGQLITVSFAVPNAASPTGFITPLLALVIVVVLQVLKWPVTVGRLMDLGRPSEDGVLLFVPIASVALNIGLMRGTPSEAARAKAMKRWQGRTLALAAFGKGLGSLFASPVLAVGAALLAGGFAGFVELLALPWFRGFTDRPPTAPNQIVGPPSDAQVLLFQILLGVLALAGLWLVLQLFKRDKASRASWLPTLILAPGAIITVSVWPGFAELFGPEPAPPGFFGAGLGLLWWVFGGGVLSTLFIAVAYDKREHGAVKLSRALSLWKERALGAMAVHGGMVIVVFVGLQLLWVPGFVYAVIMGFAVHNAMLDPSVPAYRRSQTLTRGFRRPVFVLLAVGVVSGLVLHVGALLLVDWAQASLGYGSPFIDEAGHYSGARMLAGWLTAQVMPSTVTFPPLGIALGTALSTLCAGASTAGLVWTLADRKAQRARQRAEKKAKGEQDA